MGVSEDKRKRLSNNRLGEKNGSKKDLRITLDSSAGAVVSTGMTSKHNKHESWEKVMTHLGVGFY